MNPMFRLTALLATSLLVACQDPDDTEVEDTAPDTVEDDFVPTEEMTVQNRMVGEDGTCNWTSYWPAVADATPFQAVGYEMPEPPYEIRSLSVTLYDNPENGWSGQDCRGDIELRLFAFVHDADHLDAYTPEGGGLPEIPALVEAIVSGDGDGDPTGDIVTAVLDTPVRVDEPGLLWVGYELVDDSGDFISCVLGCEPPAVGSNAEPAYAWYTFGNGWNEPLGWNAYSAERGDLRATIAY